MSSISTSFNSTSTVLLTDYFKKNASENQKLRFLYGSTVVICLISILIAWVMIDVKSILDVWWKYASILSGGMLGLFLLGIFSYKAQFTCSNWTCCRYFGHFVINLVLCHFSRTRTSGSFLPYNSNWDISYFPDWNTDVFFKRENKGKLRVYLQCNGKSSFLNLFVNRLIKN